MQLNGSRVLVTGASGGLGSALVKEFCSRGARCVLSGRNQAALDTAASASDGAEVIIADLSSLAGARELAHRAGQVDILVANAGVEVADRIEDLTADEIAAAVSVNAASAMILTAELGREMLRRRRGHVMLMSSVGGRFAGGVGPVYIATKWSLRGFGLCLAQDWRSTGVGVSLIYPGAVEDVGMLARGLRTLERQPPAWMIRRVTPERVARAAATAIEHNRLETVVADPVLKAAIRASGVAPNVVARFVHQLPASKAMRSGLISGSKLPR